MDIEAMNLAIEQEIESLAQKVADMRQTHKLTPSDVEAIEGWGRLKDLRVAAISRILENCEIPLEMAAEDLSVVFRHVKGFGPEWLDFQIKNGFEGWSIGFAKVGEYLGIPSKTLASLWGDTDRMAEVLYLCGEKGLALEVTFDDLTDAYGHLQYTTHPVLPEGEEEGGELDEICLCFDYQWTGPNHIFLTCTYNTNSAIDCLSSEEVDISDNPKYLINFLSETTYDYFHSNDLAVDPEEIEEVASRFYEDAMGDNPLTSQGG